MLSYLLVFSLEKISSSGRGIKILDKKIKEGGASIHKI